MLFARVGFDVRDPTALRTVLDADARFEEGEADARVEASRAWLEPALPAGAGDLETRPLGHLELDGGHLTLHTNSRWRPESRRALVESLAPSARRHRGTSFEDPTRPRPPRSDPALEPAPSRRALASVLLGLGDFECVNNTDGHPPATRHADRAPVSRDTAPCEDDHRAFGPLARPGAAGCPAAGTDLARAG